MIADERFYDVSVVVPLYNVSEFMPKCVDSLLAQSLGGRLQIVLVDDGSPDGSGRLADEYAALHSNITCVHRRNGGLGPARNSGIDASLGVYIGFVDGDDWVDSTMYEVLYKKAEETGADAVFSGMKTVTHVMLQIGFPCRTETESLGARKRPAGFAQPSMERDRQECLWNQCRSLFALRFIAPPFSGSKAFPLSVSVLKTLSLTLTIFVMLLSSHALRISFITIVRTTSRLLLAPSSQEQLMNITSCLMPSRLG